MSLPYSTRYNILDHVPSDRDTSRVQKPWARGYSNIATCYYKSAPDLIQKHLRSLVVVPLVPSDTICHILVHLRFGNILGTNVGPSKGASNNKLSSYLPSFASIRSGVSIVSSSSVLGPRQEDNSSSNDSMSLDYNMDNTPKIRVSIAPNSTSVEGQLPTPSTTNRIYTGFSNIIGRLGLTDPLELINPLASQTIAVTMLPTFTQPPIIEPMRWQCSYDSTFQGGDLI